MSIKSLMGRDGVTQTEMGRWLNVDQSTVGRKLKGVTPFTEDEVALIADRFGHSVSELHDPALLRLTYTPMSLSAVAVGAGQMELPLGIDVPALASAS